MGKIACIAVVAVAAFVCSAMATSAASAREWLLDGKSLAVKTLVHGTGTFFQKDSKGGVFGEAVEIECSDVGHGFVGPGALDELDEATATGCKTITGICPSPLITAVNISWMSELIAAGSELRDLVGAGTGGEPGWVVECGGIAEDTCTGMTTTGVDNLSADVDLLFDAKSEKLNCSRGGNGAGVIKGGWLLLQTGHSIQTV